MERFKPEDVRKKNTGTGGGKVYFSRDAVLKLIKSSIGHHHGERGQEFLAKRQAQHLAHGRTHLQHFGLSSHELRALGDKLHEEGYFGEGAVGDRTKRQWLRTVKYYASHPPHQPKTDGKGARAARPSADHQAAAAKEKSSEKETVATRLAGTSAPTAPKATHAPLARSADENFPSPTPSAQKSFSPFEEPDHLILTPGPLPQPDNMDNDEAELDDMPLG